MALEATIIWSMALSRVSLHPYPYGYDSMLCFVFCSENRYTRTRGSMMVLYRWPFHMGKIKVEFKREKWRSKVEKWGSKVEKWGSNGSFSG